MRLARVAEISKVFLEEGLGLGEAPEVERGSPDGARPDAAATDAQRAARLRRALERLGPTFVKFGQLLATRVDLFSAEFLRELGKLRTHVPPFPWEEARRIVEAELGATLEAVFAEFPAEPVASASIAQVYRARLRDTGEWVAVKVERPDLDETLRRDLDLLLDVSSFVDRLVPAYHRSLVHRVAGEYAARAHQEIDLLAEARAMERFGEVLTPLREFRVPRVRLDLCTARLLVMEWLDGELLERVEDADALAARGVSPRALASAMLRLQLVMSYEYGFVHGDTHPGNVILMEGGQLGLIDFGLHGEVPRPLCDRMLELLFYQSSGRTDEAVAAFLQIFTPNPDAELSEFEQQLRRVLGQSAAGTARESRLTAQLVDGLRLGARYRLRAQSALFVVLRNLTIVEGIVLTYCPELDVIGEARAVLGDILRRRALGAVGRGDLEQLLPLLLLNLSQRPQLADRLLRLERAFTAAGNLGEFLEREGVIDRRPPPRPQPWWLALLLGALGALLALAFARLAGC